MMNKYDLYRFIYRFKDLPSPLWLLDETIRNATRSGDSALIDPYITNNVLIHSYKVDDSSINVLFEITEKKLNLSAMVVRVHDVELI